MRQYAVFGHPIAHSLSPRIHSAFAKQLGHEIEYRAIDLSPDDFETRAGELFQEAGLRGANVTLPFKERALAMADELSNRAERAGAVNTLTWADGKLRGDNTDGAGLTDDLRRLGVALEGSKVLILGAGGAVRGIIGPLLDAQAASVDVANRTAEKADTLAELFAEDGQVGAHSLQALESLGPFDLVINATSTGYVAAGQGPIWPLTLVRPDSVVYDLSYGPAARAFLDWADAAGCAQAYDGLGMLVAQAAESYSVWHGVRPDMQPVLEALASTDRVL